ncbi:sensor histidine kinase [Halocola ammonii]
MTEDLLPLYVGTALFSIMVLFIILFVVSYRKSQIKFQLERQQYQRAILQTEVEIREQTLTDISRDLHDNFGQVASLIKINLNLLSANLEKDDQLKVIESKELLTQMIQDIRELSSSLQGDKIEKIGLAEKISRDVNRVNASGYIKVQFINDIKDFTPPPHYSIFVYRMFQEMINNILKHSEASEAEVKLEANEGSFKLSVKDDGIGMMLANNGHQKNKSGGNGLRNIKERCKIIGAKYSIDSSPNSGTFIEITLPK